MGDQKDKRIATIGTLDRLDYEKILKNKARYRREKLSENQKGKEKRCKRKHNIEVVNNPNNEKKHSEHMNLAKFNILFDIKSESAHFRNEDDRLFYLDQKDKRIATIGTLNRLDYEKILKNKA